jgi:hypothetical protein
MDFVLEWCRLWEHSPFLLIASLPIIEIYPIRDMNYHDSTRFCRSRGIRNHTPNTTPISFVISIQEI